MWDRRYHPHANKAADLTVYISVRIYLHSFAVLVPANLGFNFTLQVAFLWREKLGPSEKQDSSKERGQEFQAKTETLLPPTNNNSSIDTERLR